MSDPTPPATRIDFVSFHLPGLPDGDYVVQISQDLVHPAVVPAPTFSATRRFSVRGPRFGLLPTEVRSVFPPDRSLGDHRNVMPHIVFRRSTLPWERSALRASGGSSGPRTVPWLALLLFAEDEPIAESVVTWKTLGDGIAAGGGPNLVAETGQTDDEKIQVIDVDKDLLMRLLPRPDELALLAHVRRTSATSGDTPASEVAVILGNRLAAPQGINTAHLVSLEGRYGPDGFGDPKTALPPKIRLISLKRWTFTCAAPRLRLRESLLGLDPYHGQAGPDGTLPGGFDPDRAMLRLPRNPDPEAERYLAQGSVPLPHRLRTGHSTVSWYHGPLAPTGAPAQPGPASDGSTPPLPARSADELLRFRPATGFFDVSYAAAWQLGRLLALRSPEFSRRLFRWKRTHARGRKQTEQQAADPHLASFGAGIPPVPTSPDEFPSDLGAWFDDLRRLRGVPFSYLIPDPRLLPTESIRFFRLDPSWIECLLDGAFSLGRVTEGDRATDSENPARPGWPAGTDVTGLLLRSAVVPGWPDLRIEGYDSPGTGGTRLPCLRRERLGPDILMCLFSGIARRVEIHPEPEALHFGFDRIDGATDASFKKLRNPAGDEDPIVSTPPEPERRLRLATIPWKPGGAPRTLDVARLASDILEATRTVFADRSKTLDTARFAFQMVEGAETVVFGCR